MTAATALAQTQKLSCQPDFQIAVSYDTEHKIDVLTVISKGNQKN